MKFIDMPKKLFLSVFLLSLLSACIDNVSKVAKEKYLVEQAPKETPLTFLPNIISDKYLIHKGIFSNDWTEYYFTISDKNFAKFDVKVVKKEGDQWSEARDAFFNSQYSDHGMSFSPDGQTLYFSSTRPVGLEDIVSTWHIWKSEFKDGIWQKPEYVDIPNLRDKLTSHPTISKNGKLYFHSSNPDYSNMDLYVSQYQDGVFHEAKKAFEDLVPRCTPFIDPDGDFLIYANIGDELNLMISYKNPDGSMSSPQALPETINQNGQGNPSISPDGKFLFYTSSDWKVNWVSTKFLKNLKN